MKRDWTDFIYWSEKEHMLKYSYFTLMNLFPGMKYD